MSSRWQIVPVCASAGGLHRHRLAADSRPYDYDSNHVFLPRLARALPGLENWALKVTIVPCSTAEMHIIQAVSFISVRLRIAVHRKWALSLKIIILCSQKFHWIQFLSSRKWRNRPLFWPCVWWITFSLLRHFSTVACDIEAPWVGSADLLLLLYIKKHQILNIR